VREHAGLLLKDLPGRLRGGHHEHVGEADGEVEEAAVNLGELGQAAVGELVHGQQVADDGQPRRPRRKSTTTSPPETPTTRIPKKERHHGDECSSDASDEEVIMTLMRMRARHGEDERVVRRCTLFVLAYIGFELLMQEMR